MNELSPLEVARRYTARGWRVVPIPYREKKPVLTGWPDLRLSEADLPTHFNGGLTNIGVLLGDPVDVDLDAPEAVALADLFLPPTRSVFGRQGKPRSHREYTVAIDSEPFHDLAGGMLVEIRSARLQTVFPPSVHESGEAIAWVEDGEPARVGAEELRQAVVALSCAALLARHWPRTGARHEAALAAAGFLLRARVPDECVVAIVSGAARVAGDPECRDRKRAALDTVAALRAGEPATGGPRLAELLTGDGAKAVARMRQWLGADEEPDGFHLTDVGNGGRFARDHGRDVRYCYARRAWFVWSDTCWRRDDGEDVGGRAKATARHLWTEAAAAPSEDRRKALAKWAIYSESEPGIRRMLELAKSEPGIPVTIDQLDADPWLLNAPNGTLELRTGHLRPHRREDLITKITSAPYDPDARHPMLDRFLERVLPDETVRTFVQRAAGYALTASTREEKLFIAHGPTAGGKSTLLTALRRALGDYATTADAQTFMERRIDGGAPRDDLVKLIGRRLVVSSEVKDGSRMAESLVKTLFGGDDMSARALYERTVEFTPVFKLMIAANHRPRARDDDDALWRRIVEVPFTVSIPEAERDPAVKTTLCDPEQAGAAVLAWAVAGCAAWLAEGLGTPEAVRKATKAYRDAMDPISEFLTTRCVLEKSATVAVKELRDVYLQWALENLDGKPIGAAAFNERLRALGCSQSRVSQVMTWFGIRLRTDLDADDQPRNAHDAHDAHSVQDSPYTRAHEESYPESVPSVHRVHGLAGDKRPVPATVAEWASGHRNPPAACCSCRAMVANPIMVKDQPWCAPCAWASSEVRS